jgi:hypothetical protein
VEDPTRPPFFSERFGTILVSLAVILINLTYCWAVAVSCAEGLNESWWLPPENSLYDRRLCVESDLAVALPLLLAPTAVFSLALAIRYGFHSRRTLGLPLLSAFVALVASAALLYLPVG